LGVLVTGGAGYIGSHMVLDLLAAGEDVIVLDNLSTGFRSAAADEAKFVEGGDHNLVRRLLLGNPVDAIIHFADSIIVPDSVADPLGYYLNNTCKSRSLLACAVELKVPHFIFSSTAAVYGMPEANPVAEDAPLKPISPYGSSKLMTEMMLRDVGHALAGWRREAGDELRLWQRVLGARGDRRGEAVGISPSASATSVPAIPQRWWRKRAASARCWAGARRMTISTASWAMRSPGSGA
jgi:UDP-glucose 4-epimerase